MLIRLTSESPRTTIVLFVAQVSELTARALAFGNSLIADRFEAVTLALACLVAGVMATIAAMPTATAVDHCQLRPIRSSRTALTNFVSC